MSKKQKILVTSPIHKDAITLLAEDFLVDEKHGLSKAELLKILPDYQAIITRTDTVVDKDIIAAGKSLKVIGRAAIGTDNIDIAAATVKKLPVVNAPTGNAKAAAEHAVGLIFALLRHTVTADRRLRNGIWGKHLFVGSQVAGKTLGIIGLGRVGRDVARMALGLNMHVVAYDPFINLFEGVRLLPFDLVLKESDIVTLHVPHTRLTDKLINDQTLTLMKKGSFLINCARGKVVDEKALLKALKSGHLQAVALDVFEDEPLSKSHPFLKLDSVILTPHIGGSTIEAQRITGVEVASGVRAVLQNKRHQNVLNKEIYFTKKGNSWDGFDTVIFDCDSTLCTIEGIDELAKMKGVYDKIAPMTKSAMEGKIKFEDVFAKRLELVKPKKSDLLKLGKLYVDRLLRQSQETIRALQYIGKNIILLSAGYDLALWELADLLKIKRGNIFANNLNFNNLGEYEGFEKKGYLWKEDGKVKIVKNLRKSGKTLLIGDGISDLLTQKYVDLFAGFGGVALRQTVRKKAGIYIQRSVFSPLVILAAGDKDIDRLLSSRYKLLVLDGLYHLRQEDSIVYNTFRTSQDIALRFLQ